ncbi:MAG TPA: PPC domain-containing protein [Pirellulales bacterium]|jgi:hypothetical protein
MRPVFAFLLAAFLAIGHSASARAQAPSISYTTPHAVAPGQATDIVLFGGGLASPTGAWWSLPVEAVPTPGLDKNGTDPARVSYRVTVPADAAVGIYGLRVATVGGVSNLRLAMVDDLPSANDNGANKTIATAQELTLPIAVDGACEAETFDFYKFNAAAGQRVSVEVVARRLGYALDPAIRLLDATGRELAYSDDEPGLGADCHFAHTFAAAGTYTIEIRDIRYAGGPTHRYRMRIGNFPLSTTTFPMGARRGSTPKLQLASAAAGDAPLSVWIPTTEHADRATIAAKLPGGQGSAMLNVATGGAGEQVELEPNNTPETASPIALPCAINGRFDAAKDRDYYQFDAKAGQRWIFTSETRSLGSPSDLFLRLFKADGGQLAEVEDSGGDDGVLDWTAPADGVYRLMVEDLLRRGGPEFVYRINAQPYRAGFTLSVDADKFDAPTGGVLVAKVSCARRDYEGPITLSLAGAPEGVTLGNATIPEKGKETNLSLTFPASLAPGAWANIRIVGKAKIGEAEFSTTASTLTPLKAAFSGWSYPPADLVGMIGVGVGQPFPDFFQLATAPAAAIPFPQIVGATNFKVSATKLNKFDDNITLAVEGLPSGVTAKVPAIEKGKPDATIELTGPASLAEGDYPIRIVGSGSFQNQPKRVTLDKVVLRVVKPVQVALAPAGPMAAGGKQSVVVKLTRMGDANGAAVVRFKNLPPGIVAPAEVTIPEGQSEASVELSAAADVAAGPTALAVSGSLKVKDRTVNLESEPVNIEITK